MNARSRDLSGENYVGETYKYTYISAYNAFWDTKVNTDEKIKSLRSSILKAIARCAFCSLVILVGLAYAGFEFSLLIIQNFGGEVIVVLVSFIWTIWVCIISFLIFLVNMVSIRGVKTVKGFYDFTELKVNDDFDKKNTLFSRRGFWREGTFLLSFFALFFYLYFKHFHCQKSKIAWFKCLGF